MIVDSHCHVSSIWYEPVESLLFQMNRHNVDHAILTQMLGQTDNAYLFDCKMRFPQRFSVVAFVDPRSRDVPEQVQELKRRGACGVRVEFEGGTDQDAVRTLWNAASVSGLVISCAGSSTGFASASFAELVSAVPDTPVLLEHMASIGVPTGDLAQEETRLRAFTLARFPNVFLKLPGLGEFCERAMPPSDPYPFVERPPALLAASLAAFGSRRLLWSSDYPPVSGREGYGNALHWPRTLLAEQGEPAIREIFGQNAAEVFGIVNSA